MRERLAPDSEGATRKARFTEEQMVAVIRRADRDQVSAVASGMGSASKGSTRGASVSAARRRVTSGG